MKIPSAIVENYLKDNFLIKESSSGEWRINSPFCNDSKYHLYFSKDRQLFTDFKTGISGNIYQFINKTIDIPENKVIYFLLETYNPLLKEIYIEQQEENQGNNLKEVLNKTKWFNDKIGIFGKKALKYLKNRKVPDEYIMKWGYCFEPSYEFDNRIIIPFYENNKIVYIIARSIDKSEKMRYKNINGLDSKNFVFNYDKINNNNPLIICEGVFDAISISNVPATCMLSADIGKKQIKKIAEKEVNKIIFIKDNDETGELTLKRNINKLINYYPPSINLEIFTYNIPKKYKDFNEYCMAENVNEVFLDRIEKFDNNKIDLSFNFKKSKAF